MTNGRRFKRGDRIVMKIQDAPEERGTVIGYEDVRGHGVMLAVAWANGQTGWADDGDVRPA
jgi:4-aminobutyrate aminotransferase-like enzyme